MSIFSGIGNMVGGIASGIFNYKAQKKANAANIAMQDSANRTNMAMTEATNKANRGLAELANQHEIDMWNMSNAYNTPEMQMQRLQEAGLNPNLIYGSGSANTGNAKDTPSTHMAQDSAPQVQAAQVKAAQADLMPVLSMFQDWQVKKAQKDNIEAQTRATEEGIHNTRLQNETLSARLPYVSQLLKSELGLTDKKIEHMSAQTIGERLKQRLSSDLHGFNIRALSEELKSKKQSREIEKDRFNFEKSLRNLDVQLRKGKISQLDLNNMHQSLINSLFRDTYDSQRDSSAYQLEYLKGRNDLQSIEKGILEDYPLLNKFGSGSSGGLGNLLHMLQQDTFKKWRRKPYK